MIWVLGDFFYAVAFSWLFGKLSLYSLSKLTGAMPKGCAVNEYHSSTDIMFAGVITLAVVAQFLSLLGGVGGVYRSFFRLVVYFLVDAVILIRNPKRSLLPRGISAAGVLLFFVFAYGTTHGIEHYDTGLYHAQAIRWISQVGYMRGLGNLHTRLAYNSAAFAFSAVFDAFKDWDGTTTHGVPHTHSMAGFMALVLAWKCMPLVRGWFEKTETDGVHKWRLSEKRKVCLSDFARLIAVYYLFMIYDEMVSPAPDYFVTCTLLYLVIAWLDVTEKESAGALTPQDAAHRYALLCIAAVYGVTLKLSVAPLLLLTGYAVWRLCSVRTGDNGDGSVLSPASQGDKQNRPQLSPILMYFLAGCVVIAPFLIRNYYLSGYLIYPFPAIDLFDVPWKIPQGVALYDAREIAVYGRGYMDVLRYDEPLSAWFPAWFATLGLLDKGMFLVNCALPVVAVLMFCVRRRESEGTGTVTHLLIVLYAQFLFWFLSAPLVRYGKMILWLPAVLTAVVTIRGLYRWDVEYQTKHKFAIAVFLLFFLYKSAMLIRDDIPRADVRWLMEQQPYTVFETEPYFYAEHDGGGETLYAPVEGDRGGYMLLVSPNRVKVTLIGNKRDRFDNWLHPGNGFKAMEE